MEKTKEIESAIEAWETGGLGRDEEFAEVVELDEAQIDVALELQPISIRLQKSLIEDFKMIASIHGLGYQPLMRQILARFAESEKKRILMEVSQKLEREAEEASSDQRPERKAACG